MNDNKDNNLYNNNENHDAEYNSSNDDNAMNRSTDEGEHHETADQPSTKNKASANPPPINKPPKKSKNGVSALLGGLAGGIISAVIIVMLVAYNIIPIDDSTEANQAADEEESGSEVVETMSTDNAETASNISETSEAVVGVTNLQQESVWTESQAAGSGSGIIYKKVDGNAYVVTNQHVVEGAEEVKVALNDDERIDATVLGTDELTDLAVLEVDGENIDTVASLGSSSDLQVGESVMAVGNPLGMEFANSVTQGIISGLDRSVSVDTNSDGQPDWVTEVIQTDAAINPGNSGGALVNAEGEVIGINSMKVARQEVEGIGFAIPIDEALPIMEELETNGEIVRPLIGISTASLNQVPPQVRYEIDLPEEIEEGMVVAQVESGSAADEAGLQQFDVITKINGNEVTSILELRQFLYSKASIGETVEIEYYREGSQENTNLELQAQDQDQTEA